MTRQRPPICGVFTFMEKEIWKAIPGYEGIYEVSDLGRVKSLSRKIIRGRQVIISKERLIISSISKRGYFRFILHKDKIRVYIPTHQIVAITFLNHTPCGHKLVVDHIDNNRLNNRLDNLQLITQRENASKDQKGCSSKFTGVSWHKGKLKWQSYININGKRINLGTFINEEDANIAYQNALSNIID